MELLLTLWILIGIIAGGFFQIIFAYDDEEVISFRNAFYFVERFYADNMEHLNRIGLVIGIAFISIAILPGSIFWVLVCIIQSFFKGLWFAFKWIFRKEERRR